MQEAHRRWFESDLTDDVTYANVSDDWRCIALPVRIHGIASAIEQGRCQCGCPQIPGSASNLCGRGTGYLNRISFSGELGYEIYCRPHYLMRLAQSIEEAGADLGYTWYGARALMSMRLEKGWGVWTMNPARL